MEAGSLSRQEQSAQDGVVLGRMEFPPPPTDTLQYNSSDLGSFNEPIWSVVTSRKMLLLIASEVATKSQVVVYCKFYAHLQRQGSALGRDWPLL